MSALATPTRPRTGTKKRRPDLSGKGWPIVLRFGSLLERLSEDEFFDFCQQNEDWWFERTTDGELVIMPPAGPETSSRNARLTRLLGNWAEEDGSGVYFESSAGFTLAGGAVRAPDAAWMKRERWERLSDEQRERFAPICPDFVAELRSRSDSLELLKSKMLEYRANGAQLGWLIDPLERKVHVYRPGEEVVRLDDPKEISGDPVLPGFVLDLQKVWD
jgi:Uma2 family endonuclease